MNRKIPKEVKKLGNRFLPWKEDLHFPKQPPPHKGLRLSEPCGACCILDYFLDRKSFINDGVSDEGHLKAEWFIQALLEPNCSVEREKAFQWAQNGFSGMDCIADEGFTKGHYWEDGDRETFQDFPYTGHYEFKTASDQNPKPKLMNREQVIRQRVVMARHYKITDDQLWNSYIFIITKGGKRTNWISGPFLIQPTAEELKKAQLDIDLRIMVSEDIVEEGMEDDPYQHPLLKTMRKGSCTRCFPLQKADPSQDLLKLFERGRDDWEDAICLEKLTKWYKDLKDAVKPLVSPGDSVETDYFLVRHTQSGRLYLDPKNLT